MRSHSQRKSVSAKTNSANSTVPRSLKSVDAPKSALVQQIGATNSESTGLNRLKPAKRTRNRISLPQHERILQKCVAGKSITQIAREENRNRETVARIVNGEEIRELVQLMRAEFYGLAYDAIPAVRHGLREEMDARLGYRILMDIGAIPSPAEAEANAVQARQPEPEELTPFERASAQDESGQINPILLGFARCATERARMFDSRLPSEDEVWRNRTIAAMIAEMTGGHISHFSNSDSVELNRLKALAEDVLQGKRAMTDREIIAVRKKYTE